MDKLVSSIAIPTNADEAYIEKVKDAIIGNIDRRKTYIIASASNAKLCEKLAIYTNCRVHMFDSVIELPELLYHCCQIPIIENQVGFVKLFGFRGYIISSNKFKERFGIYIREQWEQFIKNHKDSSIWN